MLTQKRMKELVHYNAVTGQFTRLVQVGSRGLVGPVKGWRSGPKQYLAMTLDKEKHTLHRLAWLYMTGEWPKNAIDHINGNIEHNHFANLRDVTKHVNMQNLREANADSKTGVLGVHPHTETGKFIAQIRVGDKAQHLGSFDNVEDARQAYIEAKRKQHPGCAI